MKGVRCFIAAEIPDSAKAGAARLVSRLKGRAVPSDFSLHARWTPLSAVHFTLCFLGELDGGMAADVGKALEELAGSGSFEATIEGLGAFPRPEAARVLWAGVGKGNMELCRLANRTAGISAALVTGENEGRAYVPHLTLARFKTPVNLAKIEVFMAERETVIGACSIEKIVLFRSHLKPTGVEYEPLREVFL